METKRIESSWSDKTPSDFPHNVGLIGMLSDIDDLFKQAEHELATAGERGLGYSSKRESISTIGENLAALSQYISELPFDFERYLEKPLYESFVNGATESLSRVRLSNFSTPNTIGVQVQGSRPSYAAAGSSFFYTKEKLGFSDFLVTHGDPQNDAPKNQAIQTFTDLFSEQYTTFKAQFNQQDLSQSDFLSYLMSQGEFEHRMDKGFWQNFSDLMDFTLVKPIIELATGQDVFTGEDLSKLELDMKALFVVVNLLTLGHASYAGIGNKTGLKTLVQNFGKGLMVDFVTDASAMASAKLSTALGLPDAVTLLLSMGVGLSVSAVGNKWIFSSNKGHIKIAEVENTPDISEKIAALEDMNGSIKIVSTTVEDRGKNVIHRTATGVKQVIVSEGMTVEEFVKLMHPDRVLSPTEKAVVESVRNKIGIPPKGTLMTKVVSEAEVELYLNGKYERVKGFVSIHEHSKALTTLPDVYEGNKLNYPNSSFKLEADKTYGKISYQVFEEGSVYIPDDVATPKNYPYTGRGFTGSENIVLPEYKQELRKFLDGDVFEVFDSKSGELLETNIYFKDLGWIIIDW